MGGKTATTTQGVQIPPEVMARYNAANTRAEAAANKPFQAYSQDPNAFVAPLTATQQAGIQNINQAAGMTQPYFNTAAGLTMGGAQAVGPLTAQQIQQYQNPFTQSVVDATRAGLQQQQGQQLSQQQSEAIRAGAFGGDRAGLQRAQLMGQQGLATAQAISPLYQQAYQNAVQTAMGQQGVRAQDLQRQLAAGQQLGGLGATAQQAALAGAQAQLGAGTAEQQTEQAGKTALYNQFLQERGYDFQTAQFLANIAMGTGALSGSTTTTTQPIPFFSDEREKTNVQPLGKGLYAYDYKDDVRRAEEEGRPMPPKRVGPMAQDIEERSPGLVGEVGGHKVVKGLAPQSMGGAVLDLGPGEYRERYAPGGLVSSDDIRAILESQRQSFGPFAQSGLYGGNPQQGGVGKPGYIPGGSLPTPKLMTAGAAPRLPESTVSQTMGAAEKLGLKPRDLYDYGRAGIEKVKGLAGGSGPSIDETAITQGTPDDRQAGDPFDLLGAGRARGGLVGYAGGGGVDKDDPMASYGAQGPGLGIPTEAPDIKPLEAAKPPSTQPKSIMSDIMDVAKTAASIYAASDARMKDNIEQVGELYDGQPVYRYNMKGSPKTQLGLMAQDLERSGHGDAVAGLGGVKMVDYKRATDVAAGLAPRHGYQAGGTPSFDEALRRTLAYEGGYTEDTGGPTMMGISSRANPDVDLRRVKEDPEYKSSIYRERYWNPIGADRMNPRMANVAFDTAVNLGVGRTRQLLEEAGNDPARLLQLRQQHYNDLIASDPETYGRYGRGWSNRVNDLMAYAGGQGQAPASAAIEGAAGAPQGLGRAAAAKQETPAAQERSALAGYLPVKFGTRTVANPKGEEFGSAGEFLTSRQFVQPLLEGIGAMASSQSLSGVGAALQGLGAASKAYTGLEKEMAGIKTEGEQSRLVQAQTERQKQAISRASIFTENGVTYASYFDPKTNGYKTIRSYEYFDLPEELKPALSALDRQRLEAAAEFDRRRSAEAKPAGAAGQPAAATTTAAGAADAAAAPRVDIKLSPDAIAAARDEARELQTLETGTDRDKAIEDNKKIAREALRQRDATLRLTGNLNDLSKPLTSLAAGEQITPGAFVKIQSVVTNLFNSAVDRFGLDKELKIAPQGLTDYQLAQKASRILTEAKAANLDQRAVSALSVLAEGLADPSKTPDAAAEILASAYIEKQMALEEAKFIDMYSRSAGAGMTVAKNASSLFRNQEGTRPEDFMKDRALLKTFLMAKIQEPGPSQGKSLLSFLLQQNQNDPLQKKITPEIINQMYGTDIARYFLSK